MSDMTDDTVKALRTVNHFVGPLLDAAKAYAPLADGGDMAAAQKAASEVLRLAYEYGGGNNPEGLRQDIAIRIDKAATELEAIVPLLMRALRGADSAELDFLCVALRAMAERTRG